jgi:hypothetical protein
VVLLCLEETRERQRDYTRKEEGWRDRTKEEGVNNIVVALCGSLDFDS